MPQCVLRNDEDCDPSWQFHLPSHILIFGSVQSCPLVLVPAHLHSVLLTCLHSADAASEVRSILEDEATSVSPESDDFWVLAAALKLFVDNEGKGCLPVEVSWLLSCWHVDNAWSDMIASAVLYLDTL